MQYLVLASGPGVAGLVVGVVCLGAAMISLPLGLIAAKKGRKDVVLRYQAGAFGLVTWGLISLYRYFAKV